MCNEKCTLIDGARGGLFVLFRCLKLDFEFYFSRQSENVFVMKSVFMEYMVNVEY
jgi:hypothetical protein